MNKVVLIGNVGQAPEIKYIGNGTAVLSFSVCTSERYQDKNTKEWHEKTEWHRIVVWGKYAEILHKSMGKGTLVAVDGKLQTRSWEDKNGVKHYATEIRAEHVDLLARFGDRQDRPSNGAPSNPNDGTQTRNGRTAAPAGRGGPIDIPKQPEQEDIGFGDDDIPF